jgi:serine protease Do
MAPPPDDENVFEIGEWGIGLRDLSPRELESFEVEAGSYVAFVQNESLADEAGLPRDVAIVGIAGEEVRSTEDAIRLLEEAGRFEDSILVRVKRRDGISAFYEIIVPVPAG